MHSWKTGFLAAGLMAALAISPSASYGQSTTIAVPDEEDINVSQRFLQKVHQCLENLKKTYTDPFNLILKADLVDVSYTTDIFFNGGSTPKHTGSLFLAIDGEKVKEPFQLEDTDHDGDPNYVHVRDYRVPLHMVVISKQLDFVLGFKLGFSLLDRLVLQNPEYCGNGLESFIVVNQSYKALNSPQAP